MRNPRQTLRLALCLSVLGGSCAARALETSDVLQALKQFGVPYDTNAAQQAAAAAVLKVADPQARILSKDEMAALVSVEAVAAAEDWPEGIGYLRLNGLHEKGADGVVERVSAWLAAGKSGVILDLRGAGGDSLALFDALSSLLTAEADDSGEGGRVPFMVLVDGKTRGLSEALAAALKGRSRVILIGSETSGDTRPRVFLPLSGTSVLYVAVYPYLLPGVAETGGRPIGPDIRAEGTNGAAGSPAPLPDEGPGGRPLSEKARRDRELMRLVAADACLARAADILLGIQALGLSFPGGRTRPEAEGPAALPAAAEPPACPGDDRVERERNGAATHREGAQGK
jgi:hypothetical protein